MGVKREIINEFDSFTDFESGDHLHKNIETMMIKREQGTELDLNLQTASNSMEEILKERIALLIKSAQPDASSHNLQSNKSCLDKIKHLPLLTNLLSKKNQQIQSQSVDLGILCVAATWLHPLPDGTLPDIIIRSSILQSLATEFYAPNLPQNDMTRFKHHVVKSGLASAVSYLSDSTDETEANKKIAKDLIFTWMYYFYYNNTNTNSNTCKKPQPSVQRKTTTAKATGGQGVRNRIEKRLRQLHRSSHRKFKCTTVPAF